MVFTLLISLGRALQCSANDLLCQFFLYERIIQTLILIAFYPFTSTLPASVVKISLSGVGEFIKNSDEPGLGLRFGVDSS